MNDKYKKKTKVCLDQLAVVSESSKTDNNRTSENHSHTSSLDKINVSAPNTGFATDNGMMLAIFAVIIVFFALGLFISKKSKKVLFSILMFLIFSLATIPFSKSVVYADNSLENCQKIGYSDYDLIFRLIEHVPVKDDSPKKVEDWMENDPVNRVSIKRVIKSEVVIPGTGSRERDMEKVLEYQRHDGYFSKLLSPEAKKQGLNVSIDPPFQEPDWESEDQIFEFSFYYWN